MTRPIVSILDVVTQELVTREMNDAEYAQYLIDVETSDAKKAEEAAAQAEIDALAAAKAEAKRQALTALGLSQEIINLLAD